MSKKSSSSSGIGLGTAVGVVIAVLLSWTTWHSILWAIIAGCLNWVYVIYWAFTYWGAAQK